MLDCYHFYLALEYFDSHKLSNYLHWIEDTILNEADTTTNKKNNRKISVKEGDVLFVPHFMKIEKLENSSVFHFNISYIYAGVEFLPANKGIRNSIRKLFSTYK